MKKNGTLLAAAEQLEVDPTELVDPLSHLPVVLDCQVGLLDSLWRLEQQAAHPPLGRAAAEVIERAVFAALAAGAGRSAAGQVALLHSCGPEAGSKAGSIHTVVRCSCMLEVHSRLPLLIAVGTPHPDSSSTGVSLPLALLDVARWPRRTGPAFCAAWGDFLRLKTSCQVA
jgi:hypothetical protein